MQMNCKANEKIISEINDRVTALEEGGGGGNNGWVVATSNALVDYVENGVFKQDFLIEVYRPLQSEDQHVRKLIPFYKGTSVANYGKADTCHRGQVSENTMDIDMTTYIITTDNNVLGVNIFGTTAKFASQTISTGDFVCFLTVEFSDPDAYDVLPMTFVSANPPADTMEFRIWIKA